MAKFTELSWRGFWIATICLFGIVFATYHSIYVMPDAFSVSVGSMIGSYFAGFALWQITKFKMGVERAPEKRYFIFVVACLSIAIHLWQELSKLTL
jgi:hypothetical protein